MADCEMFFFKTGFFQNIFYTHHLASAEHLDHSDGWGKTGSVEVTVVKPNSRKCTQPKTAWKTGHIYGSGKSTEENAIFMFKLKIR